MRQLGPSLPSLSKPKAEFVQDWTALLEAVKGIQEGAAGGAYWETDGLQLAHLETVVKYVPKLIEAYTELWGLTSGLMAAVEGQKASADTLYVPDAAEIARGLR